MTACPDFGDQILKDGTSLLREQYITHIAWRKLNQCNFKIPSNMPPKLIECLTNPVLRQASLGVKFHVTSGRMYGYYIFNRRGVLFWSFSYRDDHRYWIALHDHNNNCVRYPRREDPAVITFDILPMLIFKIDHSFFITHPHLNDEYKYPLTPQPYFDSSFMYGDIKLENGNWLPRELYVTHKEYRYFQRSVGMIPNRKDYMGMNGINSDEDLKPGVKYWIFTEPFHGYLLRTPRRFIFWCPSESDDTDKWMLMVDGDYEEYMATLISVFDIKDIKFPSSIYLIHPKHVT